MASSGCGERGIRCRCQSPAGVAVPPDSTRQRAKISTSAAMLMLQIAAPKCALCWSTYAGLINASWFVMTALNPAWTILMALTATVSIGVSLSNAWRTKCYASLLLTCVAWSCLIVSWMIGSAWIAYTGIALLLCFCARGIWQTRSSNTTAARKTRAPFRGRQSTYRAN